MPSTYARDRQEDGLAIASLPLTGTRCPDWALPPEITSTRGREFLGG